MRKYYAEPIIELHKYNMVQAITTSEPGPPDLDNGEDFDPDANNGNGVNGYFSGN